MPRVSQITLAVETSIKVADFQYTKPRIEITYDLAVGEKPASIMTEARERLGIEIKKLEKHFKSKPQDSKMPDF